MCTAIYFVLLLKRKMNRWWIQYLFSKRFLPVVFGVKKVSCWHFPLPLTAETRLSAISSPVSILPKVRNQPSSFPRGNRGLCTFRSLTRLTRSRCTISVYSWSAWTWIQSRFVGGCLKCLSSLALSFSHHPQTLMSTLRTGISQRTLCTYRTEGRFNITIS